ncbi:MAG TPA: hypothetical protein VGT03_04045 [Candidatus Acidoferrales bacterium]|nr:hypothetical protein [Candidatus Acidoferrales bacterium]
MYALIVLFLIIFFLNLIPAFAPPTWMVFSYLGFRNPGSDVALPAVIGALAATLGRITLAKLSRVIIRQRFLSEDTKQNIDAIREGLQGKRKLTFGIFLFYAFSPLPSNYIFLAYGLTTLELKLIAIPFFLGRAISYSFWGLTSSAIAGMISLRSAKALSYMTGYFIATQILLLYVVYLFTRVDWRKLFVERKFGWMPRKPRPPSVP